jgi:hypothetical protein
MSYVYAKVLVLKFASTTGAEFEVSKFLGFKGFNVSSIGGDFRPFTEHRNLETRKL